MRICAIAVILASLVASAPISAAESGVATPALSYCAHWFSRDGGACVTSAGAGQLVVPDANNPSQVNAAMNHCKRAGCKVALYCECGYRGVGVAQVAQLFANVVRQHGTGTIINQVEVDHIRDISAQTRTTVARELAQHGFGLILKNSADVGALSGITPVVRVVYEDIVNDGQYRAEMLKLAQQQPTLLITGIVHQGAYGGDGGATPAQADAVFAQFKDFKNVELFYGMPSSFKRAKAFDGSMDSLARELGTGSPSVGPGNITALPSSLLSRQPGSLLGGTPLESPAGNPLSRIAPVSSSPLPAYLNPSGYSGPNPVSPTQLSGATNYQALLEAISGNSSTSPTIPSRVTVPAGTPASISASRVSDIQEGVGSSPTTIVTTFASPTTTRSDADARSLISSFIMLLRNVVSLVASLGSTR